MSQSLYVAAFAASLLSYTVSATDTGTQHSIVRYVQADYRLGAAAEEKIRAAIQLQQAPKVTPKEKNPALSPAPSANNIKTLQYLDPAAFVPERLVAAPPPAGSQTEALELASLHKLIEQTSPKRLAQAQWDGDHEDPSVFDVATGRDLRNLPATWSLLTIIQKETDAVIDRGKVYFDRKRPWGADPSLSHCSKGSGKKPIHSYPSGHSGLGYSVGWTLAQLIPEKAAVILTRANDYALSREICGVHYHSDTEASHVIGTLTAATLFVDPRLADRVRAARAELGHR